MQRAELEHIQQTTFHGHFWNCVCTENVQGLLLPFLHTENWMVGRPRTRLSTYQLSTNQSNTGSIFVVAKCTYFFP